MFQRYLHTVPTVKTKPRQAAFTLIEISIVLVVIGLIIGGILVGRELIRTAEIRSQVSQFEKYVTAVNTFRLKYVSLPGDISSANATAFGFTARAGCAGAGDGNGKIEGNIGGCLAGWNRGFDQTFGETALFWSDLSAAKLIDGSLTAATDITSPGVLLRSALDPYFPKGKISGNYIYVWSGGTNVGAVDDGLNYMSLAPIYATDGAGVPAAIDTVAVPNRMINTLTPLQAYAIDSKIDDGYPQSGNITAMFLSGVLTYANWASGSATTPGTSGANNTPSTAATAASATTCYDNGNVAGNRQAYSVGSISGNGANCGISLLLK